MNAVITHQSKKIWLTVDTIFFLLWTSCKCKNRCKPCSQQIPSIGSDMLEDLENLNVVEAR